MTPLLATLSEAERLDWLHLSRCDGVGPRTFLGLLHRFGSAAAALDALPGLARQRAGIRVASRDDARREREAIRKGGMRLVGLQEPDYPAALRAIDSAPPLLTIRGDAAVLHRPAVAIVGSRNASGPGLLFTERLAAGLGAGAFVVVSGLARGIDVQAHRGTLATGTVAVLAGGQDRVYPREHADLAARIAETGCVVSEMPLGWEPRGRDFPRRNRIVSGLALGTVVVEAARRSGSLITARFANEQGREVFAVPGSPLDPRAEGTNDLLRQGATLCTRAEDVIEALSAAAAPNGPAEPRRPMRWDLVPDLDDPELTEPELADATAPAARTSDRTAILELLGPAPVAIDDVIRLSGLGASRVRSLLLDLELESAVAVEAGLVTRSGAAVQ